MLLHVIILQPEPHLFVCVKSCNFHECLFRWGFKINKQTKVVSLNERILWGWLKFSHEKWVRKCLTLYFREANLRRSFNNVDKDSDGFLTASEVRLALKESGRDVTMQYAQKLVDKLDKDGDGKVSLEEFVAYSKQKST